MIAWSDYKKYSKFSLEDYQKFQLSYLIKFVDKIRKSSPFYKKKLFSFKKIHTYNDFNKLPLLEQQELRDVPIDFMRGTSWEDIAAVTRSSGSTGKSKIILWTREAIKKEEKWSNLGYSLLNIRPKHRIAVMMPFEMCRIYNNTVMALQNIGAFVIPIGRLRTELDIENAIDKIKLLGATHLVATPSRIINITEYIERMKLNLKKDFKIKYIISEGQILTNEARTYLSNKWGAELYDVAGANEFSVTGFECTEHNGMHIMPGPNYIEVIDSTTHKPITDNKSLGEIVITSLTNIGTPLLRYRIGDLGSITYKKCTCGLTFPRYKILGRSGATITIGGTKLYGYELEETLVKFPLLSSFYQIVITKQNDKDIILLRIETSKLNFASRQKDKILNSLNKISSSFYDKILSNKLQFNLELLPINTLMRSEGDKIKNQYLDKRV